MAAFRPHASTSQSAPCQTGCRQTLPVRPQAHPNRMVLSPPHCVGGQSSSQLVTSSPQGGSASRAAASKVPVEVLFKTEMKSVQALPGEFFTEVADRAGVDVELGCNQGNCGICELELVKFTEKGNTGSGVVIRTCIARVPPGFTKLELTAMTDQIWGVDGFDT